MEGKQIEQKIYPVTPMEYQLLKEIGHGTSATVYSAMCLPYKEIVAIKALDLEKIKDDLDVVRREAMTMTLINHPNLVKAFCSFVVEQKLWVVMPYMEGGSCLHIMKSSFPNGFNEHVIATFLKEALKALEYLHGNGYIHRDVKAGNILVDKNGIVKLADFGVSASMFEKGDRQRSRNTFVGTPCWMAPEVMEQMHGYNSSADIWSFGITAMELAHGHPPLSSLPPAKIMITIIKNAPPRLDQDGDKLRFSKSFKEMIAMCLVKDPTKRPTAENLLKHSFFKQAHKIDYFRQHILDGLPTLEEQYEKLKNMDMARLAQQSISYDEKNEKSQVKHIRGTSNWIFDVDDLKARATKELYLQKTLPTSDLNGASVPILAIVPHLKDALECAILQKEVLENIVRKINPNEVPISINSHGDSKPNSSDIALNDYSMVEIPSERERDYLQQIDKLQGKFSKLQEELQIFKRRNIILEQQLNAIFNKKEEERKQREEEADN